MKTAILAILALILSTNQIDAQLKPLEVLNPKVQQGDTIVVRINPQWQGSMICVSALNQQYMPNKNGYAFVGVGVDVKPSKYTVFRIECGRGFQLDSNLEYFQVLIKNFKKTRTARRGRSMGLRKGPESILLNKAFELSNRLAVDMTDGTKYIYPVDSLDLDPYATLTHPFGHIYRNNRKLFHSGSDFKMDIGTPVKAVNDGRVVLTAFNFRSEGNMVIINHGLGIFSVYMHLSRIDVGEGNMVKIGNQIGLSGDSGTAKGNPHLHYNMMAIDLYSNNNYRYLGYVDPLIFINTVNPYLAR